MRKMRKLLPFLVVAWVLCTIFCVVQNANAKEVNTIEDGVVIGTIDVGGMTEEEAATALEEYVAAVSGAEITLFAADREITATAAELGIACEEGNVLQEAMDVCKKGNIIKRYKDKKDLEQGGKVFELPISVNEEMVTQLLADNSENLNIEAVDNGLIREDGEFVFIAGTTGVEVNTEESIVAIEEALNANWNGESIAIELVAEVTEPKGSKEELSTVQDVLGAFSTNFSTSAWGRCKNIEVATGKINGIVLYPGEELSVGQTINPLDAANGYELAGAYENGQTVQSYGGGVCQVSSTLYNAALYAELEISQRSNHSMIVTYVQPSKDAAIAGDYKDLKIVNNKETPIYIEGYISGKNLYFNIYGQETRDENREVEYISEIVSTDDPVTQFVATADPVGYLATAQSKHVGYVAQLWKVVKEDGVEVSREKCNSSTYKSSPKIVHVGTASADASVTAAINAAIATGDEATVYAAVAPYAANVSSVLNPTPSTTTTPEAAPSTPAPSAGTSESQTQTNNTPSEPTPGSGEVSNNSATEQQTPDSSASENATTPEQTPTEGATGSVGNSAGGAGETSNGGGTTGETTNPGTDGSGTATP